MVEGDALDPPVPHGAFERVASAQLVEELGAGTVVHAGTWFVAVPVS